MTPRGRRRPHLSPLALILSLLLLFSATASAASAVLGVDLGTEYIKAALVKPGVPLEIVLSKDSKRKELSAVAFKTPRKGTDIKLGTFPERSYGSDAIALAVRFPGDVYPNLKPLLGLSASSEAALAYGQRYPELNIVAVPPKKSVGFKSNSFHSDELPYTVEELLAMELKNVRENAQAMAGKGLKIENAVFTFPAFYTAEEKMAIQTAAELAGFKVIGLVSDGLAVGINYATTRSFPVITDGEKPEHHLVLDIGAGSMTATVLQMNGRSVKDVGRFNKTVQEVVVLGTGWDRTFGGDALNNIILDDMIAKFIDTPAVKGLGKTAQDIKSHGRTAAKLWREAEKVRQVLSANQNTVASFEGLYEDIDFKYKVTRNDFEAAAASFADRLEVPITQALKAANLAFTDIESVILHGGASRTPFIQKKLEELAGGASKLRSNVNADEAAAFGAAFKAAGLSPSFRVKEIRDFDSAGYSTFLYYKVEGKSKSQKLFTPTSSVGVTKLVPFKDLDDFTFTISQTQGTSEEGATSIQIKTLNLTDSVKGLVAKGCKKEEIFTGFAIRLDPRLGLPEVVEGTVSCEVEVVEKEGGVLDSVKGMFGFGSGKKDDPQQIFQDEDWAEFASKMLSEESASSSSSSSSAQDAEATDKASSKESKDATPALKKKKMETVQIKFTAAQDESRVSPPEDFIRMHQRLIEFDRSDRARKDREEDMNNLEAFLYKVRDHLSDESFRRYSSAAVRSQLEKLREDTSEWMSEASSATSDELKAKLQALIDIVKPVILRQSEAEKRPEHVESIQQVLDRTKSLIGVIEDSIEQAARSEASSSSLLEEIKSASSSAEASTSPSPDDLAKESDPLADLEEPDLPPAWSSSDDAAPTPEPFLSPYTAEDLKTLKEDYDKVASWLEEKLAAQEELQLWDDPAFEIRDLEHKTKQLNDALMALVQKKMVKPKAKKPSASKAKSSKSKKGKSSTAEETSATSVKASESLTSSGKEAKVSMSVEHNEL